MATSVVYPENRTNRQMVYWIIGAVLLIAIVYAVARNYSQSRVVDTTAPAAQTGFVDQTPTTPGTATETNNNSPQSMQGTTNNGVGTGANNNMENVEANPNNQRTGNTPTDNRTTNQ